MFVLKEVVRSNLHGCAAVDSASALDLSLTWEEADLQRERWSDEMSLASAGIHDPDASDLANGESGSIRECVGRGQIAPFCE